MEEKGRNERIRELTTEKVRLAHNLRIYKTFGPHLVHGIQKPDDYENAINAQIDGINTKLYLLGQ